MSKPELAIDADGQPFTPPPEVTGWRVRRIEGRGRPELAHDSMGRPLVLPIDATFPDLYRAAGPGRYRLDPVDASGQVCPDVPVGCTGMMQPQGRSIDETSLETSIGSTSILPFQTRDVRDDLLIQAIRANTQMAEQVIRGIPAVLTAASELINAADGAKLPQRQPPPLPAEAPDYGGDEPDKPPPSGLPLWLSELIQVTVKSVVQQFGDKLVGKFAGIPLGALVDWSKAAPAAQPASGAAVPAYGAPTSPASEFRQQGPIEPQWFSSVPAAPTPGDPAWFAAVPGGSPWFTAVPSTPVPSEPAWFVAAPTMVAEPIAPEPIAPMPIAPETISSTARAPESGPPIPVTSAPSMREPSVSEATAAAPTEAMTALPTVVAPTGVAPMPIASALAVPMSIASTSTAVPTRSTPSSVPMPAAIPPSVSMATLPTLDVPASAVPRPSGPGALGRDASTAAIVPPGMGPPVLPSQTALVLRTEAPSVSMNAYAPADAVPNTAGQALIPSRMSTDDSTAVSAHVTQIYGALSAKERERTQQLVAALTPEERIQWLIELASLSLPDAIARVRHVIRPHTPPMNPRQNGAKS